MIEEAIQRIIASHPPSSGENLLGFEMDVFHAFMSLKNVFSHVDVARSDDHASLINIRMGASERATSVGDILNGLHQGFTRVAYGHFAAHAVVSDGHAAGLRFATVMGKDSYFVTGTAIVTGDLYERLAEMWLSARDKSRHPVSDARDSVD